MKILHIHQDYPDNRNFPYTKAVSNLISAVEEYDESIEHYVLSLNRTSNPFKMSIKKFDQGLSVIYWGLPLPYIYLPVLWLWSVAFYFYLKKDNFTFIHAHKLTTEGVVAHNLSSLFNIPFLISIRGGSDLKNIYRLPCSRKKFKLLYQQAQHVFWVSPWAKSVLYPLLGKPLNQESLLPNICNIENIPVSELNDIKKKYITAISFHQYKRKGIIPLIEAISRLKKNGVLIKLDVYGGGSEKVKQILQKKIIEQGCESEIILKGEVKHNKMMTALSQSKGLLLPATNETFGLVYIEALASGTPILFHAKTGIDGFFNINTPGVSVNNQEISSLMYAIQELDKHYKHYRQLVRDLLTDNGLQSFQSKQIVETYLQTLLSIKQC